MSQPIITKEAVNNLGIKLEGQELETLLTHLNDTLAERVGNEIIESLDEEQMKTLVELQETATPEQLNEWLQTNVKELNEIAQDEVDILLGEIAENSDAINENK